MTSVEVLIAGASPGERAELAKSIGDIYVRPPRARPGRTGGAADRLLQLAQVTVNEELALRIYVLAGDPRFAFMWGILAEKAAGSLILVDGERPDSLEAARAMLRSARRRTDAPFVVGVTSGDRDDGEHRAAVAGQIGANADTPVVPLRCGERESVKAGLCELLRRVQEHLRGTEAGVRTQMATPPVPAGQAQSTGGTG
ncbi:MAG: hypothetical protein ACE5R4_06110 [Armatimonadota bacterium]